MPFVWYSRSYSSLIPQLHEDVANHSTVDIFSLLHSATTFLFPPLRVSYPISSVLFLLPFHTSDLIPACCHTIGDQLMFKVSTWHNIYAKFLIVWIVLTLKKKFCLFKQIHFVDEKVRHFNNVSFVIKKPMRNQQYFIF